MGNYFEQMRAKGVSSETAKGFMPFTEKDGVIRVDFAKAAETLAQDAAITTPTAGVPAIFTTYIDPQVVPILFGAQNSTRMFDEERRGDFATSEMQFGIKEVAGSVTSYSDYAENISTDVNFEFTTRDNYVFETVIKYGEREIQIAGKAKLNLVSEKQQGAAYVLAAAHNKINLLGVAGKRVYGMLNAPNLPTSLTPIVVSGNSTWASKQAADPANFPNVAYNDINKMWADLCARNGGHIDETMRIRLGVAPAISAFLSVPNVYGLSALTLLKKTYPNLEVVQLPELATNAGNTLFMEIPELLGTKTAIFAPSEKARFMNVIPKMSSYQQKVAGATFGCVYKRPSLVSIMTGV